MKEIDELNSISANEETTDIRIKERPKFVDGQEVTIAGIITSVKKNILKTIRLWHL